MFIDVGLILPDPQELRGGKARQRRVGGYLYEPLPAHPLGYLVALPAAALVAPDDGAAQYIARLIQHHKAVHLPREAHALYVRRVHPALPYHLLYGGRGGSPPVPGLLLGPAVLRLIQGVLHSGAGYDIALPVEKHRLCAAGAQVHAYDIFHPKHLL